MIYHFCTYFDVNYLPRGLALYASLRIHCPHFKLWVLCMDSPTFEALQHLRLPGIQPIRLDAFEAGDHHLLEAKKNRSQVEYYFTCTPSLPLYIFRKFPEVEMITYLDADLYFFDDPSPLFDEMGDQSIAIIGHRFPPALRAQERFGIYNVGWLSFKRDEHAAACLQWWRMKCIEWCYDRVDNGRFADQKYLDVWPEKFQKVVVLQHHGANLAPWNLANYNLRMEQEKFFLGPYPLIFFHFHGLKHLGGDSYDFNLAAYGARMNEILSQEIFSPYIRVLSAASQITSRWQSGTSSAASIRYRKSEKSQAARARPTILASGNCGSRNQPEAPSELHRLARSPLSDRIKILNKTVDPTTYSQAFQQLSRIRRELTDLWLNTTESELPQIYAGDEGQLQREIMDGPVKEYPISPADRQKAEHFIESIGKSLPGGSGVRCVLAAMLYLQPYEFPGVQAVLQLPEWFQDDYLRFLIEIPHWFRSLGEVEAWCDHMERLTAELHAAIDAEPHVRSLQKLAFTYAIYANLMPFYFVRRKLKPIVTQRAEIVDFALRIRRYDLESSLPIRPVGRSKLRLGIHCRGIAPYSEMFATLPIFKFIDRSDFEIYLYVNRSDGNPFEMSVRRLSDKFTLLPGNIKESVQKIREDDLDILFFGNNITDTSGPAFLLANHRLARVQGIHFCNPVTSGQRHIDFFLLGRLVYGKDDEQRFTEKVLRMQGSGICFDLPAGPENPSQAVSRAEIGVEDQRPLFISGANYCKITPELRHLWARVISRVPDSMLLLYPFGPAWANEYPKQLFTDDLRAVFVEHGISPSRLIVVDTLPGPDAVMALNRIADIYLDAVPYNGATSLLDPLRAGIPVVVADGGELRFAQGAAMLRELGVPELIAADEEDYIRLAVRLGNDDSLRQSMRERIRERMSRTPDFLNPRLYGRRVSQALLSLFPDLHRGTGLKAATPEYTKVDRPAMSL